ncbi:MAG: hypothetical protein P8127_06900 [Acidobacteriota bacterium]|jgi:hypothetical protein
MPIHLRDLDIVAQAEGVSSALIVPCNLCPAVTVAVNQKQPFMKLFRSVLKSAPFEQYIKDLRARLGEKRVKTEVFRSSIYHQWFMCMWTGGRRKKLEKAARKHDAVIVLGCDTANETVRDAVRSTGVRVIEGMQVAGLMNAKLSFQLPGNVAFKDCRIIPISEQRKNVEMEI